MSVLGPFVAFGGSTSSNLLRSNGVCIYLTVFGRGGEMVDVTRAISPISALFVDRFSGTTSKDFVLL